MIVLIHNNNKECFTKIREIWNKITKLMFINNAPDFIQTTLDDDDDDEIIEADTLKDTVFTDDVYDDRLVIVLHSVINDCLQASVMQVVK